MQYVLTVLKGMAMGIADVIPGVSGGTIALVVGIYSQFIEGLKSVNFRWVVPLFRWIFSGFSRDRWPAVAEPVASIHWGFLVPLGSGIVVAFGIGSVVVPYMMDRFPVEMATFFIGLILASTVVPYRQMPTRAAPHLFWGILAAVLTFLLIGAKAEPIVTWVVEEHDDALTMETFMREHPSVGTAEQLYCPTGDAHDNVGLRAAIAADPAQPGLGARLDALCVQLDSARGDIAAMADLRDRENLGRKDELNPFNNALVPPNTPVNISRPAIWFIFLCGVVGICAMVLPGISGSFILLVLGVYHFMLSSALKGFISDLVHGELPVTQGVYVVVFSAGCLIGILSFARVMSHLFHRHPSTTLAALIGMMLGSLRALWPWKIGEPHTGVINTMPPLDSALAPAAGALVLGVAIVLALTWVGTRLQPKPGA